MAYNVDGIVEMKHEDDLSFSACDKLNWNFKQLMKAGHGESKSVVITTNGLGNSIADLDRVTTEKFEEVDDLIDKAKDQIDQLQDLIDQLEGKVDEGFDKIEGDIDQIEGDVSKLPDTLKDYVTNAIKDYWKTIYPVGSLYLSFSSTSPKTLFGGTWVKLEDVFLRAGNDTETGGEDEHTLSSLEMPSHDHTYGGYVLVKRMGGAGIGTVEAAAGTGGGINLDSSWADTSAELSTGYSGSGAPFNNMPAYQNIHVWRRTA